MKQPIKIMMKIGNWLLRIIQWFAIEPRKIWSTLPPFIVGYIFCFLIPAGFFNGSILCDTLDTRFRLTGLFFEVLGIGTVVYGILATLKLFDENHWEKILGSFRRFPKFTEESRMIIGSINATLDRGTASFSMSTTLAPNLPIEDRVTFLEDQLKQMHLQIRENRSQVENELKKLSDTINVERTERKAGDIQAQHVLKKFAIEDIYTELIGIVWLISGAILATASTELAKLFS